MKKYIYFGETVEGYQIPVLNEQEARAGAGILLLPTIASFVNSYVNIKLCVTFLFSETAFGICIGCILYHKI